jgi:short-subunit dehydrogenase
MKTLRGRVAVVTGAGSGIGRAVAHELKRAGCHLALVDVDERGLAQAAAQLAGSGTNITSYVSSVADREAMRALPEQVIAAHGAVHIVINNAGITILGRFEELSEAEMERMAGVNFWGVVHGCRFFMPHLQQADEAHIVNVSSMAAFSGMPFQAMYCATKAAVRAFSQGLSAELADTRVGLTAVFPGAVRSNIMNSSSGPHVHTSQKLSQLLLRHGYPAERAARKIVRAIQRNQPEVRIGGQSYLFDLAQRISPTLMRFVMRLLAKHAGRVLTVPPPDSPS